VALGTRRYLGVDPFFGEQRVDRRTSLELVVRNKEWRWRSLKPALVLGTEENRSNIDFFSYRKANVSIAVE
jgi:Surface lipoprotein assembly modifier